MFSIGIAPAHPFSMSEQSPQIIKLFHSYMHKVTNKHYDKLKFPVFCLLLSVRCVIIFIELVFLCFPTVLTILSTVMNFAYTNTEKYGLYKME